MAHEQADLPPEGPRERAQQHGIDALSNAELLAVLLGTGSRGCPVELLASRLLAEAGGLAGLRRLGPGALADSPGLGAAKGARVAAALELGARAERLRWQGRGPPLPASRAVDTWARPRLGGLAHEELWALALDGRQRMRAARMVARGGLAGLHVAPRDVLRVMLREGAHGFVLVHNHPSGDPTPSLEDVRFTRSVEGLAAALGLPLLDHVVVAHAGYVSLLDAGLLASARPPSQGTPARAGEEPERLTVSGQ